MLVLDPIYFECVRQGNAKKLQDLLYLTKDLQYGVSPDDTFRVGSHNRPAINLAIEAGHTNVGRSKDITNPKLCSATHFDS